MDFACPVKTDIHDKRISLDTVEKAFDQTSKLFGDSLKLLRAWRTDIGELNQLVLFWSLADDQTNTKRASYDVTAAFPDVADLIVKETSHVLRPAPFSQPVAEDASSPVHEIRLYRYNSEAISDVIAKWENKIQGRTELSKMLFCGYSEAGPNFRNRARLVASWRFGRDHRSTINNSGSGQEHRP